MLYRNPEPDPPSKPSNSHKDTQGDPLTGRLLTRTILEGDSPDDGWPGEVGGDGQKRGVRGGRTERGSTDYPKDLKRRGSVAQSVIVNLEIPGGGRIMRPSTNKGKAKPCSGSRSSNPHPGLQARSTAYDDKSQATLFQL